MNSLHHSNTMNTSTLSVIQQRIQQAEQHAQQTPGSCVLVGASKTQSAATIRAFHQAGLNHFGENYLNEAIEKIHALNNLNITWHYIGGIQSNKTKAIAENFAWVHTIDRLKIAKRLSQHLEDYFISSGNPKTLNVLLQVNLDDEASKNGVSPDAVQALAQAVSTLPHLQLRGLMSIPQAREHYDAQLQCHLRLAKIQQQLNQQLQLNLDTLSMGMSGDLTAAIAAGSTMVRIGTDLFGKRAPSQ